MKPLPQGLVLHQGLRRERHGHLDHLSGILHLEGHRHAVVLRRRGLRYRHILLHVHVLGHLRWIAASSTALTWLTT